MIFLWFDGISPRCRAKAKITLRSGRPHPPPAALATRFAFARGSASLSDVKGTHLAFPRCFNSILVDSKRFYDRKGALIILSWSLPVFWPACLSICLAACLLTCLSTCLPLIYLFNVGSPLLSVLVFGLVWLTDYFLCLLCFVFPLSVFLLLCLFVLLLFFCFLFVRLLVSYVFVCLCVCLRDCVSQMRSLCLFVVSVSVLASPCVLAWCL